MKCFSSTEAERLVVDGLLFFNQFMSSQITGILSHKVDCVAVSFSTDKIHSFQKQNLLLMNQWFDLIFLQECLMSSSRLFFANSRLPLQSRADLSTVLPTTFALQHFLFRAVWPVIWVQRPVLGQFYHHKFPLSGQVIDELSPTGWPGWEETYTGGTWAGTRKVQAHMPALVYSYTVHNAESHAYAHSACVE